MSTMDLRKTIITGSGTTKVIIAANLTNLLVAIAVAQSEVPPVSPDINNRAHANKRYKDLN